MLKSKGSRMHLAGRHQIAQSGFSLIELMISMAISLIVIGATTMLVVNISRTSSETARYTRSNQDMRTVMAVMVREIKRAGYNAVSLRQIGTGTSAEVHSRLLSNADGGRIASCLLFGYDTLDVAGARDSTPGVLSDAEPNEWRGFRRTVVGGVGVVQMRLGGPGVGLGCDGAGHTWVNLTDPRTLDVTELRFDFNNVVEAIGGTVVNPANVAESRIALVGVRAIPIRLRARSPTDPLNVRELRQWARVRADSIRLVATPPPPAP